MKNAAAEQSSKLFLENTESFRAKKKKTQSAKSLIHPTILLMASHAAFTITAVLTQHIQRASKEEDRNVF